MKIPIKPQYLECQGAWSSKRQGVVLVKNEEDKKRVYIMLCEQDDYWENYPELVQIAPVEINSIEDIKGMCRYCGKTDIYMMEAMKDRVDFMVYQYDEEYV